MSYHSKPQQQDQAPASASIGHLLITFRQDGQMDYSPDVTPGRSWELAGRFQRLCKYVVLNPDFALDIFKCRGKGR